MFNLIANDRCYDCCFASSLLHVHIKINCHFLFFVVFNCIRKTHSKFSFRDYLCVILLIWARRVDLLHSCSECHRSIASTFLFCVFCFVSFPSTNDLCSTTTKNYSFLWHLKHCCYRKCNGMVVYVRGEDKCVSCHKSKAAK